MEGVDLSDGRILLHYVNYDDSFVSCLYLQPGAFAHKKRWKCMLESGR